MYKQIIPATDWFHVEYKKTQNNLCMYRIVAWGLTEEGQVIGLISVNGSQQNDGLNNKMARLVTVPPTGGGMYKHRDELSELEREALQNDGYLKGVDDPNVLVKTCKSGDYFSNHG